MKVLIAGAGVAGLTLAYWLHEYGHTPVVIEKAPHIRTDGYMIDFAGSGYDVANRMGIVPQLKAVEHSMKQLVYKDSNGKTASLLPIGKLYRALELEGKYMALDRRDLVEALYRAIQQNVETHFGVSVASICQSAENVTVTFTDDTQDTFDIVVGADGVHSIVRKLAFGAEQEFDDYLGYYVTAFYIPALPKQIEDGYVIHLEPDVQLGVYPFSSTQWLVIIIFKSKDRGYILPQDRLGILHDLLSSVGWIAPDIVHALSPDIPIFMDAVTQIHMPKWSSNRVALVGDAAYCLTLISGQGASMAMAGAYFLAQELKTRPDYYVAFNAYEKRLRPYIERTQLKAKRFAPTFIPDSQFRIAITNWAIRLMDLYPVAKLVGKQLNVQSIIGTV